MRYNAEWLDGEYVLLNYIIRGENHSAIMQRAIRLHALFGSTVVLSDVQMIDSKTPVPTLFLDRDFRTFLNENKNFLALVAERGAKDQKFGIAMKGIERANRSGEVELLLKATGDYRSGRPSGMVPV